MSITPEKIEQNKKYSAIFFLIVFVVSLVFSVPVFADSSPDFSLYHISSTRVYSEPYFGIGTRDNFTSSFTFSFDADPGDYYVFYVSGQGINICSESPFSYSKAYVTFSNLQGGSSSAASGVFERDYNLYTKLAFSDVVSSYSATVYAPTYSSIEEGLAAVRNFIDSHSWSWQKLPYLIGSDEMSNYSYYLSLGSRNGVSQYGATEAIYGIYPAVVGGSLFYLSDVNTNGVVSNGSTAVKLSTGLLDSSSQIYHSSGLSDFTAADTIPVFSDIASASASLREFLGGSSSATDLGFSKLVYDLPAGNAIYIPIPQNVSNLVSLTTTQPLQSVAFNVYDGSPSQTFVPFLHANQRYGYSNSLPSSANNVIGSVIPWYRASTGRNLLGQTKDAYYTFNTTDGYQYLYIVNPYYQNVRNVDSDSVPITSNEEGLRKNNSLHIEVQYAKNVKVYPLSMSVTYDGGFEDLSDTPTGQSYTGDISSGTGSPSFTDDLTGDPVIPGESTANTLPSAADTFGSSNNFQGWLQNFLSGFVGIFEVGHNAILTLVGYASAFFGVVGSLYAWLPSPVYTVLVSAISLVITIGIIKVFL